MSAPRQDPEALDRARAIAERRLTPQEVKAALSVPLGDDERRGILALVEWFCRRYPTPADRLAYVRRAYRRWTAGGLGGSR